MPSSSSSSSTWLSIAPSIRLRCSTAPSSIRRLQIWLIRRGTPPEASYSPGEHALVELRIAGPAHALQAVFDVGLDFAQLHSFKVMGGDHALAQLFAAGDPGSSRGIPAGRAAGLEQRGSPAGSYTNRRHIIANQQLRSRNHVQNTSSAER